MNDYIDIGAALHTNSLTLFVGTGFSKYLTNGTAPNWMELIELLAQDIDASGSLLDQLFHVSEEGKVLGNKYELTICAQILEIEYDKKSIDFRDKICSIIREKINKDTIDADKLSAIKEFFGKYEQVNIVTTNYDTLLSEFIMPLISRVIIEDSAIPRINAGRNIYHIHGCISKPSSLIITLNDYYNFQNSTNYFSRKFFTLLQETTVVILGYSLGDFNLNTILSEVKNTRKDSFRKSSIYYVSKTAVPKIISNFYSSTYGIKVIERKAIDRFFQTVEDNFDKAVEIIESVSDLSDVVAGEKEYTDDFIKLGQSFASILVQASSIGIETTDNQLLQALINILQRKRDFTGEDNAWVQYEHLADWLVELACVVSIPTTEIEKDYCDLARHSFSKASRELYRGYSWYAWQTWNKRWDEMKSENQKMLKELIDKSYWNHLTDIESIYKG